MLEHTKAMGAAAGAEETASRDTSIMVESGAELAEDEIAVRAYSYWEERGGQGGSAEEDWYRAIEELAREHNT